MAACSMVLRYDGWSRMHSRGSTRHLLWEYAVTGARRHRGGHQPLIGGLVSPRPDSTVVERHSAGAMSSNTDDAAAMLAGAVKHYGSGESAVVAHDAVTIAFPTGKFTAVVGRVRHPIHSTS